MLMPLPGRSVRSKLNIYIGARGTPQTTTYRVPSYRPLTPYVFTNTTKYVSHCTDLYIEYFITAVKDLKSCGKCFLRNTKFADEIK